MSKPFFLLAILLCCLPLSCWAQLTWSFCYQIVGYSAGVNYTTLVSGSITTLSTSVTVNSRSAYNVTSLNGTRVYSDSSSRQSTSAITGVYPTDQGSEANFTSVDLLLYPSWPFFDSNGILYTFSGTAQTPSGPVSGDAVIRLSIDAVNPAYSELIARTRFNEEVRTASSTSSTTSTGGDLVVSNDNGAASAAGTIAAQCSPTTGASASYAFCYYAEQDPSTLAAGASPWSVLTYGTLQATGPVSRRGRPAVIAHSASGYRVLTTGVAGVDSSAYTSYVTGVRGIDLDESSGFVYNDNAMYLSAPYLDDEGLVLVLSTQVAYPSLTVPTTDVQLYRGDIAGYYDEITPFVLVNGSYVYGYASTNASYFQYSTALAGAVMAASKCRGSNVTSTAVNGTCTSTSPGGNGASREAAGLLVWLLVAAAMGWQMAAV